MKFIPKLSAVGLSLLSLAACQSPGPKVEQPAGEVTLVQPLLPPFPEPARPEVEMDGDMLFSYLVGELGSRRQELELAYPHYMHVGRLIGDAYAAEKATWIASAQDDLARLAEATALWVSLAPNDSRARIKHAEALFRQGHKDQALAQLNALGEIVRAKGGDTFTVGGSLLKNLVTKDALLPLMQFWVASSPESADALSVLGGLQLQAREYASAEENLRKAIALRPDWARPWRGLVFVLIQQGRNDEAMELASQGVEKFPRQAELRLTYGRMLHDTGAHHLALEQFRVLQRQTPKDHKVVYMRGLLAVRVQAWDEAREAFQLLRGDTEFRDEASYYLAQVEEFQGNAKLAMGLYGSVGHGPLYTDAGIRLATLEADLGKLAEARERLAGLRMLDPAKGAELYVLEIRLVWKHLTDKTSAFALYDEALQNYPGDAELLYSRGLHAAEIGRVDLLESDMRTILAEQPDHAEALNALGYTLADQTKRYQEAFILISKAHALEPDSAAVLDSLGWVHYRLGHYDKALRYLRQAIENLMDAEIAAHLGEVLWVTGSRAEARKVWREGYDTDADNAVLNGTIERFDSF